MAEFIQNLYVPSATGSPGVLTNIHLAEVEPGFARRTSNFVPYSSLYHTVYPHQRVPEGRRHRLYKWSVVGALVLLVGVVVGAGVLLAYKNSSVYSRVTTTSSPISSLNISSTTLSNSNPYNTSVRAGTVNVIDEVLQDRK